MVKKHIVSSFPFLFLLGFSSLIGSLTPVQSGSDALRSLFLKKYLSLSHSSSFQASFVVKGLKFFLLFFSVALGIAVLASGFFFSRPWFLVQDYISSVSYFAGSVLTGESFTYYLFFLSGFFVVFFGALVFLLPLNASFSGLLARFFSALEKRHSFFGRLRVFFEKYPLFFRTTSFAELLFFGIVLLVSWAFEFLALFFSFLSFGVLIPLHSMALLFLLMAILERTPFLPRGIGVVEVVSFYFLSLPGVFFGVLLQPSVVGAILVVYGLVRIAFPVLFGFAAFFFLSKKYG